jgi:hypothetical protein
MKQTWEGSSEIIIKAYIMGGEGGRWWWMFLKNPIKQNLNYIPMSHQLIPAANHMQELLISLL